MELSVDTINKNIDTLKYIQTWGFSPNNSSYAIINKFSFEELKLKIESLVKETLDNPNMPMEYQVAYFKMIFLIEKLYLSFPIFSDLSEKQKKDLKTIFINKKCLAAPELLFSVMVPQQIKIYNPIARFRRYIKVLLKNKISRKKND